MIIYLSSKSYFVYRIYVKHDHMFIHGINLNGELTNYVNFGPQDNFYLFPIVLLYFEIPGSEM